MSSYISPSDLWIAGFFSLAIPVTILVNIILLALALRFKRKSRWIFLIALIIGLPHITRSYSFSLSGKKKAENDLTIMSYNVESFNLYDYLYDKSAKDKCVNSIQWLSQQGADVIAIQEFYEDVASDIFNVSKVMKANGYPYSFIVPRRVVNDHSTLGLAFYSKVPIKGKGVIPFGESKRNKAAYIDVAKNGKTLRVYNCHLESMNIDTKSVFETNVQNEEVKQRKKKLIKKLRTGFVQRAQQVKTITFFTKQCEHPLVICCDLNDLPYSYTYHRLDKYFENAFEEKGNGFGFTFNNSALSFLRIDNQFFSEELEITRFKTLNKVHHSDHFPILGTYRLN